MAFSKQRRRGNDGFQGGTFSAALKIPKALETDYYAHRVAEAEEAKRAKAEKVEKKRGSLGLPEAKVLAMRALKEYCGWTTKQLAAFYGRSYSQTYQICAYITGGGKIPVPADAPKDVHPPAVPDKRFSGAKTRPSLPPQAMMANTYAALSEARQRKAYDPEAEVGENG